MVGSSGAQSEVRAGHPDLGQARADRILASDERSAARGATLLSIVVREGHAFVGHRSMLGVR